MTINHDEHEMDFGIFVMPERYPWDNWTLSYKRIKERAQLYERLNFDEIWYGEHHSGAYENVPNPAIMIANIAAITDHIKLATGAVQTPWRDPFFTAENLAFLDQITEGRIIAGLGGSGIPSDQQLFSPNDFDPDTYREKMNESVEAVELFLNAEEPVSYDGEFFQYDNRIVQVPPYQEEMPIGVPGMASLNSYEKSGLNGYWPLSPYLTPLQVENNPSAFSLKDHANTIVESAKEAGRDPKEARKNWRVLRHVYVAETKEEAIEDVRAGAEQGYDYLKGLGLGPLVKRDEEMHDEDLTIEWMIENIPWIIGSPIDCIKQIKALYDEVGGFGGLMLSQRDWMPTYKKRRSLELFAQEVMPAFKDRVGPRDWILEQLKYEEPEPDEDVFGIENSVPRWEFWDPVPGNKYSAGEYEFE